MHRNPSQPDQPISGLILAGGRASRMGGGNKGLIHYHNKPLVAYAEVNLSSVCTQLLVCTNTNKTDYRALGYDVIDDGEFAWCGPLAGILAGLRAAPSSYLAIAACDQLSLPPTVYPALFTAAQNNSAKAAIASDGKRIQPTCAVLHCDLAKNLLQHLRADKLRVGWWFKEIGAEIVTFEGTSFDNINSREDLK